MQKWRNLNLWVHHYKQMLLNQAFLTPLNIILNCSEESDFSKHTKYVWINWEKHVMPKTSEKYELWFLKLFFFLNNWTLFFQLLLLS